MIDYFLSSSPYYKLNTLTHSVYGDIVLLVSDRRGYWFLFPVNVFVAYLFSLRVWYQLSAAKCMIVIEIRFKDIARC